MSEPQLVYSSKINKIRGFALILIFIGMIVMYGGILSKKIPWLIFTFFLISVLFIIFCTVVYFWIVLLSTRAVPILFSTFEKSTKMLDQCDVGMHCKQP